MENPGKADVPKNEEIHGTEDQAEANVPKEEGIIENEEIRLSITGEKAAARKPFLLCHLIVEHPYLWFGIGFCIHLSFVLISLLFWVTDWVTVIQIAFDDIPLIDRTYEPYHCFRSFKILSTFGYKFDYDLSLLTKYKFERQPRMIQLYYNSISNDNILVASHFKRIQTLEQKLMKFMNSNQTCNPHIQSCNRMESVIGLLLNVNSKDPDFKQFSSTLDSILLNASLTGQFMKIVSKDFKARASGTAHKAKALRTDFVIEKTKHGIESMINFLNGLRYEYRAYWDFYFDQKAFAGEILLQQIKIDSLMILGSIVFIYTFTWVQTRNLFVTIFAVTSIFTSFFLANLIHTVVFRIKFFGLFHVLSIFLILGFGCDNIYVFYDRWKLLQSVEYESLAVRLTDTYLGVGWSMFITSSTTSLAFFILTLSPLLTIFSFGMFVVLLVVSNYISVLLYIPSIIVVSQLIFSSPGSIDHHFIMFTRLFEVQYFNLLCWKQVRYVVLLVFVAVAFIAIGFLFRLRVSEQFPELMISSTMLGRLRNLKLHYFHMENVDTNIDIVIVFGIKKMDFSLCKFWNYSCRPRIMFDKGFQINKVESQTAYQKICDEILNANETLREKLALFNDSISNIKCITTDMDNYFMKKYPYKPYHIPWIESNFNELISTNFDLYGDNTLDRKLPNKFETAMYYFMTDGNTFSELGEQHFNIYLSLQICSNPLQNILNFTKPVFPYGRQLTFSAIEIKITLFEKMSGFTKKKNVFKSWISWIQSKRAENPSLSPLVCGAQEDISLNGHFHWIHVQESLNSAALRGVVFGLLVAAPIIFCASRNIYTFAAIMMGTSLSTLTVIGIIPIVNWKLGLLESINITVIVGLTIDYLVHMGLAFNHSEKETKEERTQDMLSEMGVSIISSMLTTLGSAFFLFFCKVKFLFQFGIFVFITIFSAGIYSMVFLPCLLLAFGPGSQQGNLQTIIRRFRGS